MKKLLLLGLAVLGLSACKSQSDMIGVVEVTVSGFVEKGPFVQGSVVTLSELNDRLESTGTQFTATVSNDQGAFSFSGIAVASKYAKVSIDGFCFDEVRGRLSQSRIVLSAYVQIDESKPVNVNVLTHLESDRVRALVLSGVAFAQAKEQAQSEVLKAFGITQTIGLSETLSITSNNSDAGVLIAVSSILLKGNTEASLTEMMHRMGQDLVDNGALDNVQLVQYIDQAHQYMSVELIRQNIVKRYADLGRTVVVPDFSEFVPKRWKPDPTQPIRVNLNLAPVVASKAPVGDMFAVHKVDVFVFSADGAKCLYKTQSTNINANKLYLELPQSIMGQYDGITAQKFSVACIANSSTDFNSFQGGVEELKNMSEQTSRPVSELNFASAIGKDLTKDYVPAGGFSSIGYVDDVLLSYEGVNDVSVPLVVQLAKVVVVFETPAEVAPFEVQDGLTLCGVSQFGTPTSDQTDISQQCSKESGALFYLYPSSGVMLGNLSLSYGLGIENVKTYSLQTPALLTEIQAGFVYRVVLKITSTSINVTVTRSTFWALWGEK